MRTGEYVERVYRPYNQELLVVTAGIVRPGAVDSEHCAHLLTHFERNRQRHSDSRAPGASLISENTIRLIRSRVGTATNGPCPEQGVKMVAVLR